MSSKKGDMRKYIVFLHTNISITYFLSLDDLKLNKDALFNLEFEDSFNIALLSNGDCLERFKDDYNVSFQDMKNLVHQN